MQAMRENKRKERERGGGAYWDCGEGSRGTRVMCGLRDVMGGGGGGIVVRG